MAKLAKMTLDELTTACAQLGVQPCPGRERDRDELLDAVCDASWDGAHGTPEEFDRRAAALLGLQ